MIDLLRTLNKILSAKGSVLAQPPTASLPALRQQQIFLPFRRKIFTVPFFSEDLFQSTFFWNFAIELPRCFFQPALLNKITSVTKNSICDIILPNVCP